MRITTTEANPVLISSLNGKGIEIVQVYRSKYQEKN